VRRPSGHSIGPTSSRTARTASIHAVVHGKERHQPRFLNRWPEDIFSTIDAVSRSGYLLAYTPRRAPDDKWRKVVVRVRRPVGARVLVRDTYLATSKPPAYDPSTHAAQQAMLTVAQFPGGVDDLQVQATAKQISATATTVDVTINVSRVQFTRGSERHVARLEVAVFCMDGRDRLLGQRWVTLDLKLTDDTLAKVRPRGAATDRGGDGHRAPQSAQSRGLRLRHDSRRGGRGGGQVETVGGDG
jgi:hypothetical protein